MLRRVIDLTLTTSPINPYQRDYPPPWSDLEATGPERDRLEMQKLVKLEPFHLDGHPDELMMNVTIGHSTGHTHVDVFLHDWNTMFEDIPRDKLWAVRDVSQVPSHELLGPVAIVDISELAPYGEITLDYFRTRAAHVEPGDMVFMKTGHPAKTADRKASTADFSVIGPEIAQWLADEKRIRVFGCDHKINGNFAKWSKSEQVFYRTGVLMIDRMANLDALEHGQRLFASVGISFKMQGTDDSPARVFVLDKLSDLRSGAKATDLYYPITCPWDQPSFPFTRSEPFDLRSDILRRYHLQNVHISQSEYEHVFAGDGFMGFKSFCNCLGTHLRIPKYPLAGADIPAAARLDLANTPTDRLWGKAVLVDAWGAGPGQDVTVAMLEKRARQITAGSIVLVRTAFTDFFYHQQRDFVRYSPGFTAEAVRWLIQRGVKMVVTDTATIESAKAQGQPGVVDNQRALFEQGIPVVLSATSLWRISQDTVTAFVSPMALPNTNASPCRVLILEEYP